LLFINPADAVPLRAVLNQLRRDVFFVYEDETLDKMLHEFKRGRSHVAVVQRINSDGPGDPVLENIGPSLISLEVFPLIVQLDESIKTVLTPLTRSVLPGGCH
jgi:metal transporter CNNM